MERMFPQPKEFVKVNKYVIKDSKAPYDRYWNKDLDKWVGLLKATRFTKEEAYAYVSILENGEVINFDEAIGLKKG